MVARLSGWARGLWPDDPGERMSAWVVGGLLLLATAANLLRSAWGAPLDRLWAEDGAIFVSDAEVMSWSEALTHPYAGYMHAVARLITESATAVPTSYSAAAMSIGAALTTTALAIVVYRTLAGHLRSRALRAGMAGYMAVLPIGHEVVDVAANVHWVMLFASFCVLMWRPRSLTGIVIGALVLLLSATSDPFVVLLIPIVVARLFVVRERSGVAFLVCLVTGVTAQLVVMADAPERVLHPLTDPLRLAAYFATQVLSGGLFGENVSGADRPLGVRTVSLGAAGSAVILLAAVACWRLGLRRVPPLAALAALYCVVSFVALVGLSGVSTIRYAVPSALFLVLALVAATDRVLGGEPMSALTHRGAPGIALASVFAVLVLGWMSSVPITETPWVGSRWSAEVDRAEQVCASTPQDEVALTISPRAWKVVLPCSVLASP